MAILLNLKARPVVPRQVNRLLHAGAGLTLACGLIVCAFLKPNPSGVGTHRQLGLPGCLVCRVTGLERCPSCGLTTGLTHLMRGHWAESRAVHPAAPVVLAICCAALCYCLVIAVVGADLLFWELLALAVIGITGLAVWLVSL